MTIARKFNTVTAVGLSVFFAAGLLVFYEIVRFGVMLPLVILNLVVVGVYRTWTTCPGCGKPVVKNPVQILDRTFWIYSGMWIPQACTKCGFDFHQDRPGNP
jgi:hypothetical protein